MIRLGLILASFIISISLVAQEKGDTLGQDFEPFYLEIDGDVMPAMIQDGDTIILDNIMEISISAPRNFNSAEELKKYRRYRAYAAKVYPYAVEAIRIYREYEYATANMSKKKRKKYIKKLKKELKQEFEEPLKGLTKTQGRILVKMIERELDIPMYDLIKRLQGRFKAFMWNQSSKVYGYRLKKGYKKGENPILDIVLQDFNISYQVQESYSKQRK